ncbi:MAG: ABC transporter ATP-binding protein [Candidatus Saccharimonadales bacterium]
MKKLSNKINPVIKYYWRKARAYPLYLNMVFISVPVTILLNSYLPALILANVLGRLSKGQYMAHDLWGSFGTTLLLYLAVLFGGLVGWRIVDWFVWRLEWNVQQDIAEEVFDHMLNESADFHANNFTGSLVSHTNKLLGGYARTADTTIFSTYPLFAGIAIVSIILWFRAPMFVIILLAASALFLACAFWISKPVRRMSARYASAESQQTGYLADAVTNIMAIKSFARGKFEKTRFHQATSKSQSYLKDFAKSHRRQMNYLGGLSRVMNGLALFAAVYGVLVLKTNIATVFLIFSYTSSIVDSLFQFSNNSLRNYNRSFGDAAEMVETLSQTPAVIDPSNPEPSHINNGEIEFDSVDFTHNGSDEALFNDLSIKIKHGEKVGLVGHSGSGKTTFMRLLLRFSDIDGGEIRISGQNIAKITQDDLHEKIAYVPQEPLLFHRTLAENISYGKSDASQKDIVSASKKAHAHEFIELLPDGYETLVGERGVKLSGGQRQRVAIARAMLKDAPILALDEATSALDSESEKLIQEALWQLMEGRTAIVIAHRLSTIQHMDRIVVMDDGKIVEEGSHQELLKNKKGIYTKLWARQSGGFLDD